ncbi:hypothetical protein [Micromonospora sp. 4G55]|uniref:hypothetical protein n=1 Tax=Micromonospora sp. 4G55 TaxID=2806102 RepID=UPI001A616B42|nr:hypothetical protein [Micromonospora sp. 4G55]MBM0256071.1 hypothetical protein [Micromonospora sp. 4G55]
MNRDLDDDLHALRRMLPVSAERDFPAGRYHQREEHLMISWLRMAQRPQRRPNRAVRFAIPVGLAAAVAGTVLVYGQDGTPALVGGNQAQSAPATTGQQSLGTIKNVAYSLQRQPSGDVKLIIEDPHGKPNADKMRADLARLGVTAQVLMGHPNCHDPLPSPKPTSRAEAQKSHPVPGLGAVDLRHEDGKAVAYIHPDKIPAGHTLTLGFRQPDAIWPLYVSIEDGNGPDCIPTIPADTTPTVAPTQ